MKVEIFEAGTRHELEKQINTRLKEYKNDEIIDIKYSGKGTVPAYSTAYYSAMIIFKNKTSFLDDFI